MKRVHVVCVGNICRSPLMEEVLRTKARELSLGDLEFSSSGITAYNVGNNADPRMMQVAKERGYDLEKHRVKKFELEEFDYQDLILAATRDILEELLMLRELGVGNAKLLLATSFSPKYCDMDIPDPFLEGDKGFSNVVDLCEDSATGLLTWIAKENAGAS